MNQENSIIKRGLPEFLETLERGNIVCIEGYNTRGVHGGIYEVGQDIISDRYSFVGHYLDHKVGGPYIEFRLSTVFPPDSRAGNHTTTIFRLKLDQVTNYRLLR